MKQTLADLFTSKKFLAALTALVVYVAGRFGLDVDPAKLDPIWQILLVYVGAQGVADLGKGAAQVKAAAPAPAADRGGQVGAASLTALSGLAIVSCGFAVAFCLTSCATTKAAGKTVLGDVVDCTSADRAKLYAQFGPTMEQVIARATGLDGKIDLPSLQQVTAGLEVDGWCVLERAAAQAIAAVLSHGPGTASAVAQLDPADLSAKVSSLRVSKFGATRFQLGAP